jgi:hypothetical protein
MRRPIILLIGVALALALVYRSPEDACYVPSDQTVGWKRVMLPNNAPKLAARDEIDQFRSEEEAIIWDRDPEAFEGARPSRRGRVDYLFRLRDPAIQVLEVELEEPLQGAKVDVTAHGGGATFPLMRQKRVTSKRITIDIGRPGLESIDVSIYHHLRPAPIVHLWRTGRRAVVADQASAPPTFHASQSLYFLHPGGKRVVLCETHSRTLQLDRAAIRGDVTLVALTAVPSGMRQEVRAMLRAVLAHLRGNS